MFSYIRGLLAERADGEVTVETAGVGWRILVPLSVLDRLPRTGSEVKLFTSFQVKEDGMTLYGFLSQQDRKMFGMLLTVSGVGPKAAMGILSALTPDDLRLAVVSEDAKAIAKAPGIGPKTARRIILELKDRIRMEDILPAAAEVSAESAGDMAAAGSVTDAAKEAMEALVALGYSPAEAMRAVRRVPEAEGQTPEDVLKASLKYLAF